MKKQAKTDSAPKDFASRSGLLKDDRWEYENKESYKDIARYFLFIAVAGIFGYIFMLGVLS